MSGFADLREIRQIGAPIVGLFRTALARDPDPTEIARLTPAVRDRTPLSTIAAELVASAEFAEKYRSLPREERNKRFLQNAFGSEHTGAGASHPMSDKAASDAESIALITDAALMRNAIPLLPGLVPGASPDNDVAYRLWVAEYDQSALSKPSTGQQRVSVLMKAGDTEAEAVQRSVASLSQQTHQDWELCLAARTISPWSRQAIETLAQDEPRVRLVADHSLNAAFAAAHGALVGTMAPGDGLASDALARVIDAFDPSIDMVFTDEDVEDVSGRHSPRFKPGFSPDLLLDDDAIGGLAIVRRDLVSPSDLEQDAILRNTPTIQMARHLDPARVRHLPIVALHRAAVPKSIDPDIFAGAPFAVPHPAPSVTVIVLTKDHPELLDTCVRGLLERTDYPALELVLVDNGTTDGAALDLLAELDRRERVRVLRRSGPFNFAALNNEAAATVSGGMLILLNNDVEVLRPEWLSEMVAQLARPGVGVVGARLLYPDRTIQHAGMLLGPGGTATHVGRGAPETATGYLGQLTGVRDFSAVTGACLAIEVETWNLVGGMDERFAVTWNDVDLCLRVRRAGLRVVWTPRATLIHKESSTRGLETADPAKLARFREEQALMLTEWSGAFDHDPFLNANLVALDSGQLALTRPHHLASRA